MARRPVFTTTTCGWTTRSSAASLTPDQSDYVRVLLAGHLSHIPVAPDVFGSAIRRLPAFGAGAEAFAKLEIAQKANHPRARAQAIRWLRREDPYLLRRTPVPKSRVRDYSEQWEILLQAIEMKGVEK